MKNANLKRLTTYARHRHVVERYRYWTEVQRRREDDVIAILCYQECFFEKSVIYQILKNFQEDSEMEAQLKEVLSFVNKTKNNPNQTKLFS